MTSAQKVLVDFHRLVDVNQQSLLISLAAITFNPTAWNIVARHGTAHPLTETKKTLTNPWPLEYRNKTLTSLFGSPRRGCYFLALAIFSFGILRDHLYVLFFVYLHQNCLLRLYPFPDTNARSMTNLAFRFSPSPMIP
jgi:phosphatidylethanolamine N-methyltransferase